MKDIKINDLETTEISAEEVANVKGGPAYIKLGDIKGELSAKPKRIQKPTVGYTEVEWTY